MFGGLEIKGDSSSIPESKKEQEDAQPAVASASAEEESAGVSASSGFSFLSPGASASTAASASASASASATNDEPSTTAASTKVPEPSVSGFNFLASTLPPPPETSETASVENETADNAVSTSAPAPATSGFSFMATNSAPTTAQDMEEVKVEETVEDPKEPAAATTTTTTAAPVSSFSFMSSLSMTTPTTAPAPASEPTPTAEPPSPAPAPSSMFSMLTMKTSEDSSSVAAAGKEDTVTVPSSKPLWGGLKTTKPAMSNAKPPLAMPPSSISSSNSNDDILSMSNPSQPTGSGIVFGGAAKPKGVKKRSRAKKIGAAAGIGIGAGSAPIAAPVPSIPIPETAPVSVSDTKKEEDENHEASEQKVSAFSKLSKEADDAAKKAEEFINSKQTSSYTGRYSGESTIVEDYGDTASASASASNNNVNSAVPADDDEETEDYKKAMAAAQEAMKNPPARKMGFGSGISGFFKRNMSGSNGSLRGQSPSLTNEESNHSNSHAPATKGAVEKKREEVKVVIPVYGEANSSVADDNSERGSASAIEAENNARAEKEDELKRLEQKAGDIRRKMLEEKEKIAMEDHAKREQERAEKARIEMEELRRKKEEEEAAAAAAAAAKRTPQQLLEALIQESSEKSQKAVLSVVSLRQERAVMMEKRILTEKQERLAAQQISQAEKHQIEAAEREDFELADQLAAVIEEHQKEQEEKSQILENIDGLIENLDYKKLDVGKGVWACFTDGQSKLKDFLQELEGLDIADSKDVWAKFESDKKHLSAENERLSADLKNIERDEGFVEEERNELEANISEQTSDLELVRDEANKKLDVINTEIDDLRRQLDAKEMEAAAIKMELHQCDGSIDEVRSKFSRQLARLGKKESAVKESRSEWEAEDESYRKSKEEHEAEVTAHSEALIDHENLINRTKEEINVADELAKIIAQEVVVSSSTEKASDTDGESVSAQAGVLKSEAAVDEANQLLSAAIAHIESLRNEISDIEKRLPILESEKKNAASRRDFKAAAKASKEIKELNAKKENSLQESKTEALDRQMEAEKKVQVCVQELEEQTKIAHEVEKKSGSIRMVTLVKRIIKLEKLREEVCGIDESDSDSESFKSIGGFVLDAEISALVTEGQELDKKFGGWDDLMIDYATKDEISENDQDECTSEAIKESSNASDVEVDNQQDNADTSNKENEVDRRELLLRYKEMSDKLKAFNSELDTAIETEEYDVAAEIDDKIHSLQDEMKSLGLSDDEKTSALSEVNTCEGVDDSDSPDAVILDQETPADLEASGEPGEEIRNDGSENTWSEVDIDENNGSEESKDESKCEI